MAEKMARGSDDRRLLKRRGLAGEASVRSGRLGVWEGQWTRLPGTGLEVLWGTEATSEAGYNVPLHQLEFAVDIEANRAEVWDGREDGESIGVLLTGKTSTLRNARAGALRLRGTLVSGEVD